MFNHFKMLMILCCVFCLVIAVYAGEKENLEGKSLKELAAVIHQKDADLTMAVTDYAKSGDDACMANYNADLDVLIKAIDLAIAGGDSTDKAVFKQIEEANSALAELEDQAVSLVKEGKKDEAVRILESEKYLNSKATYGQGLDTFYKKYVTE
ncbi:hypothetical protein JW948_16770 [bacterium]|nr:hypothetical protein [bacterium]